ncbi:MAG: hypothetical protein WC444_04230 [Candidatus Paceibacterota bacterium]
MTKEQITAMFDANYGRLKSDPEEIGLGAFDETIWDARAFFLNVCEILNGVGLTDAPLPVIGPAGKGSIDFHWKQDKFELLINYSMEGNIDFYADNYKDSKIQGCCTKEVFFSILNMWRGRIECN